MRIFFFNTPFRSIITALLLFSWGALSAQDSCTYRLRIYDQFGDNWDGSTLFVRLGNNPERQFTHEDIAPGRSDSAQFYDLRVRPGDSIVLRYVPQGSYQSEIRYSVFNNAGELVFADGPTPRSGIVFRGVIRCVACGSPISPVISSVRTFTATINWRPANLGTRPVYRVEWDTAGFVAGRARNRFETTDTFLIMQGLSELTRYDAYVRTLCPTDTSSWVGPLAFRTDTATNVGVSAILSPISRCDLGIDSVRIRIRNYGGAPQSLIPFKYSVNNVNANIQTPADGLFTGVISKDSSATIAFKALYDFSTPGDYNIAAWTELDGDRNRRNDTFRVTLTRPRRVTSYPYVQDFESGKDTWSVFDPVGNTSWAYATPRYRYITNAASGTQCWTTAPDTSYKNRDTSYLLSPCFDFTSFSADPRISLSLNVHSEARFDGAWLEGSNDGGTTWYKIGRTNTGVNWYNDVLSSSNQEVWTGTASGGWRTAQNTLTNMAGRSSCRVRFAFLSDATTNTTFDGVAIDNVVISAVQSNDLAADSVSIEYMNNCRVTLKVSNLGSLPQTRFTVGYRLANGAVITEQVDTTPVAAGGSIIYRFRTPLSTSTLIGNNQYLRAWVSTTGDNVRTNDTLPTSVIIPAPVRASTVYTFDDLVAPAGWTARRASLGRGAHGNVTTNGYLFANIYFDSTASIPTSLFHATAGKFGPIRANDSLSYDYRFVTELSPYSGYNLTNKDTMRVQIAGECDTNFVTVDTVFQSNHSATNVYRTRRIALGRYVGQYIKVRVVLTSDIKSFIGYFFDLDNINFKNICPNNFGVQSTVRDAVASRNNGSVVVRPTAGVGPFNYQWSNGSTLDSVPNLAPGTYTVTITDANGCIDLRSYTVRQISSTFEPNSAVSKVTLAPNPTTGTTRLEVEFNKTVDARVQVINLVGQVIFDAQARQTTREDFDLDLSDRPAGIYLVRIVADNKSHVTKLVKQ